MHDVGRTRQNCVNHELEASDCDFSVITPVIRERSIIALVVTQLFQLFKSGSEKTLSERAS